MLYLQSGTIRPNSLYAQIFLLFNILPWIALKFIIAHCLLKIVVFSY